MRPGTAVVIPVTRWETAAVARTLLSLADDPGDVRTQRGGMEFLVPEALAGRYHSHVNRRSRRGKVGNG